MWTRARLGLLAFGALVVAGCGSGSAGVPTTGFTASSSFAPPRGAVVLAAESGSRAVALAAGDGRLTATVLGSDGSPESGLRLAFRVAGKEIPAKACGDGCYTAPAPRPAHVDVVLGRGSPVSFDIPSDARPAGAIVARATRVFRRLRSLVYVESLRSSPKPGLVTTWKMQAPDRVSFRIRDGASAVVIGNHRWDRAKAGAPWKESEQAPKLSVPSPTWGNLTVNAHVLGAGRVNGRAVWIVSFVNPSIPAWFTAWIDRRSYRTLQLRMTAASHFMFHRYLEFDRPLGIRPPG